MWFHDPRDLFRLPETEYQFVVQLTLYTCVLISVQQRSLIPIIVGLIAVCSSFLLCECMAKERKRSMSFLSTAANVTTATAVPTTPITAEQQAQHARLYEQQQPQFRRNAYWNGQHQPVPSQWSPSSHVYPNNPTLFDTEQAMRSTVPSHPSVVPDPSLTRMFGSPTIASADLWQTPLPDPTFIARQWTPNMSDYGTDGFQPRKMGMRF